MALALSKVAETSTTITLGWTPYAGIECYAFFANGQKVSMADDRNKDGSLRSSVKFSKTAPGPPFNVVALVKLGAGFAVDWGQYPPDGTPIPQPPPTGYWAIFYISPSGNDLQDGTLDYPFLTLGKARDAVRAISASQAGDIAVVLRAGTYRLSTTLALTSLDSGQNGHKIVWRSYPGETVTIDGGLDVSTGWEAHTGGIYRRAGVEISTRHLFVNGIRAQRARGASNPGGWTKTSTGYTAPDSSMASWGNKDKIEIVSCVAWKMFRGPVASISGTAVTMKTPYWTNAHVTGGDAYDVQLPTWIENAYELLSDPGEFYLDDSANVLYYKPRTGETLGSVPAVLTNLQTLIQVTGAARVEFQGITFAHAGWGDPSGADGYAGLQAGVHFVGQPEQQVKIPAALDISAGREIAVRSCIFTRLGASGIDADGGCSLVVIENNLFTDLSGTAIQAGEHLDAAAAPALQNTSFTIRNNRILNVGVEYRDCAAIFAGYVLNTLITHNEIGDVPYTGISLGWGWGETSYAQSNVVSYNYIHNYLGGPTFDGGGVYTLSSQPGSLVTRNHIIGASNVFGALYPDEGSAYIEWSYNVCRSNYYQWLHIWTSSIHDLNVHDNWTDTSSYENAGTNITMSNNTLVTNENWPTEALIVISEAGPE